MFRRYLSIIILYLFLSIRMSYRRSSQMYTTIIRFQVSSLATVQMLHSSFLSLRQISRLRNSANRKLAILFHITGSNRSISLRHSLSGRSETLRLIKSFPTLKTIIISRSLKFFTIFFSKRFNLIVVLRLPHYGVNIFSCNCRRQHPITQGTQESIS